MRTALRSWLVVASIILALRAFGAEGASKTNSPVAITVIKCSLPSGAFEIVGTDVSGVKSLDALTKALRKHKELNPAAKYELVSDVKCPPDGAKKIVKAIARADVTLDHFWAARGYIRPGTEAGPYGAGYVDLLERYKATR